MICPKGIFVFESKNYSGWIFGGEDQKSWYQTLAEGRGKCHIERFYNPIMQNAMHITHLKEYLGEDIPTRSIVVFSDRCELKRLEIHSKDVVVINRHRLVSVVASMYAQIPYETLDKSGIARIYDKLYPCSQVDENVKAHHIENIRRKKKGISKENVLFGDIFSNKGASEAYPISDKKEGEIEQVAASEQAQQEKKCPFCGGKLVVRTATKGDNKGNQFYGCSNYPRCHYIEDISK